MEDNKLLNSKIMHYQNICTSIIDAIGRVLSTDLAEELERIVENGQIYIRENAGTGGLNMSQTIYEALATHQSQRTVSDWSQGRNS